MSENHAVWLYPQLKCPGLGFDPADDRTVWPVVVRKNEDLDPIVRCLGDRKEAGELDHTAFFLNLDTLG